MDSTPVKDSSSPVYRTIGDGGSIVVKIVN
jgi:hypothetical protein